MGLFDFMKSKEEKERDDLLNEIHQQVFPGGSTQIMKEIKEVRELLDFKYTFDEVKTTYLHAVGIFVVAADGGQDRIVTSILHNSNSVVTKSDAIKIYNYLVDKRLPKKATNILDQDPKDFDDSTKIFLVAKGGVLCLKTFKVLTLGGRFEVTLFCSIILLNYYQSEYPKKYDLFEEKYFQLIFNEANLLGIPFNLDTIAEFVNHRFRLYFDELDALYENNRYFPGRLYNCFYESPLTNNPIISQDLTQVIFFHKELVALIKWLEISFKKITMP